MYSLGSVWVFVFVDCSLALRRARRVQSCVTACSANAVLRTECSAGAVLHTGGGGGGGARRVIMRTLLRCVHERISIRSQQRLSRWRVYNLRWGRRK